MEFGYIFFGMKNNDMVDVRKIACDSLKILENLVDKNNNKISVLNLLKERDVSFFNDM